ncbi:MAG: response regulator transcription factor [Bacteroidetes bacterium]|nr:response regulator transcription factor [Bacteroidota bacterium]
MHILNEDLYKILIVEDEIKIAESLKQGLEENGFVVDVCNDGNCGLLSIEQNFYHLIILDINLPSINGYELCKLIRQRNLQVPIIMLTALSSLRDKLEGYDTGADDYIIKPFEFKELLMKIRVLLRRTLNHKIPEGTILRAGNLEINLESKEVKRGETTIHLTMKEFQLLEYLMRNKNHIVSRANIAIHVWDIDFDTNTNVIDVYISYLRNKIDKPFSQKLIHTQVGFGYILSENQL